VATPPPVEATIGASASRHPNPLVGVPRLQQRDCAQLSQRDRTCFSSSCAMLLEALKPGTLPGANGDDAYLAVVQSADFDLIEEQVLVASGCPAAPSTAALSIDPPVPATGCSSTATPPPTRW